MSSLTRLSVGLLAALAFARASTLGATTVTPLDDGWQFRLAPDSTLVAQHPDQTTWTPAHVPGSVQTDLLTTGNIGDPFFRDNEAQQQWIGLADWDYQLVFNVDAATLKQDHVDLVFDGVDTFADISLNDKPLLKTGNMFRRWRLPVKDVLHAGSNTLTVRLHSPIAKLQPWLLMQPYALPGEFDSAFGDEPKGKQTSNYVRKANYQYGWDWGPRFVTMGIWQPVQLESWTDARLEDFHVAQPHVDADNAELAAEVSLQAGKAGRARVTVNWTAPDGSQGEIAQDATLKSGENTLRVPFAIAKPERWWPAGYGMQNLYRFHMEVKRGNDTLASADRSTGLRSVELRRDRDQWGRGFAFVVNGVPIFAKGADLIPTDSFPERTTPEQLKQLLTSTRDANMNMLRMWGGGYYQSDAFYDLADQMGIMIWQDFMFGGAITPYDHEFLGNSRVEAEEQVRRLRNHPSIVLWCGNNEVQTGWESWPDRIDFKKAISTDERQRIENGMRELFGHTLREVVKANDPDVPYWASSPSTDFDGEANVLNDGDYHYWKVWSGSEPIDHYLDITPRFQSEYGLQSFPVMSTIESFATPADMTPNSPVMRAHQKFANGNGNDRLLLYIRANYGEPKDFASFVYLSQLMQAEGIELAAEHLRSARPQSMGSLYWQLNDVWPGPSWSSIDYYGRWKALQFHAKRFYAPVDVVPIRRDGHTTLHLVSDRTTPFNATLRTRVYDMAGKLLSEKSEPVEAAALSSTLVGEFSDAELLHGAKPTQSVASFDVIKNDEVVAHHLLYFGLAKTLNLPKHPGLGAEWIKDDNGTVLRVSTKQLARGVWIDLGKLDATFSNNAFDLLPGEHVDIAVNSQADLHALKSALKLTSLIDTVKPETTR
ncbi:MULTISPECIES: glycoside hydrolase family 2 protein [unclassified Dyella]|uniref:beta-mannosidase n=2 Tax=Gammaproteobacteria TaxID=1236 RepID=UPI000C84E3FE|nr:MULTISPECIES: glycoside hydrolase family 2 protein [unclassified Dyella]MDR3445057.1 glycoside hydrolase family 2 protein [Dyella sp.]PMQ04986.1 Exo-beta-D-glucosaminidase [Dyella sp. AD56]